MAWPDALNEVEETVGATGRNHSTIAAWEAATDEDCTAGWGAGIYASPCSPVGVCYDDADFGEDVVVAGATTSGDYHRRLTVASGERHAGKTGDGVKIVGYVKLGAYDDWFVLEDVIVETALGEGFADAALYFHYAHNATSLLGRRCVIDTAEYYAIKQEDGGLSPTIILRNLAIHGGRGSSGPLVIVDANPSTVEADNCSAYSGIANVLGYAYVTTCTNCIAIVTGTAYASCGGDYNIGSDTSAPGANSIDNETSAIFADAGGEDLHLASDATAASGAGDDLSAEFTDDIEQDTRSDWDIGADEYVGVAGIAPTSHLHGPLVGPLGGPV